MDRYITLLPCVDPHKFLVVVMVCRNEDDGYLQTRVSQCLSETAAQALAQSWSAAMGVEVR